MKKILFILAIFSFSICFGQDKAKWYKKMSFKIGANVSTARYQNFLYFFPPPREEYYRPVTFQLTDNLIKESGRFDYAVMFLPSLGVYYQLLPLDRKFNVQIGTGWQRKGFVNPENYPSPHAIFSCQYWFLELSAQYYLKKWLYLKGGIVQNQKINFRNNSPLYMRSDEVERIEHSGLLGLGTEVPIGQRKLIFEINYEHGLSNIVRHPIRYVDSRFYYQVWNFSLGFRL